MSDNKNQLWLIISMLFIGMMLISMLLISAACNNEPVPKQVTTASSSLSIDEGKELYNTWCQACHGKEGKGDGLNAFTLSPPPSDLTHTKTASKTDEQLIESINKGSTGMRTSGAMSPYASTLKDYQIKDIVAYLRKLMNKS